MNASSMFIFMLVVVKPLVQLNAIRKCVCVGGGDRCGGSHQFFIWLPLIGPAVLLLSWSPETRA